MIQYSTRSHIISLILSIYASVVHNSVSTDYACDKRILHVLHKQEDYEALNILASLKNSLQL